MLPCLTATKFVARPVALGWEAVPVRVAVTVTVASAVANEVTVTRADVLELSLVFCFASWVPKPTPSAIPTTIAATEATTIP
jgi:hypothetical protein